MSNGTSQAQHANDCPFASELASRLKLLRDELVRHWLDRISARVSVSPERIFPTQQLLDHMPILIDGIADYLANPISELGADPVVAKALELGELRHRQGFDAYEIMKEYEVLGGILFHSLSTVADDIREPCAKSDVLTCGHRLFYALAVIQQATMSHFLQLAEREVAEREARIRAFNRMVSHEIKNDLHAVLGAGDLLATIDDFDGDKCQQLASVVAQRAHAMKDKLDDLVALTQLQRDVSAHRHVRLPEAVQEACRQVRDAAQAANVSIRVAGELPPVEVNAAVVELALTNYLTNAIKYARRGASESFAEISGQVVDLAAGTQELVVRVTDNGVGVAPGERKQLFQQFFRSRATATATQGTGLGLSIVRDTVESIGGRAWAEFLETGSVFALAVPLENAPAGKVPTVVT